MTRQWVAGVLASAAVLMSPAIRAESCLDEAQWQALQQQSGTQPVLLYVWSPRMVLSARHAAEVQQVATDLAIDWLAVHDGRVPDSEIQQARQTLDAASQQALAHSQPLCAQELIEADAYRHFPTAWLVQQGRAETRPLVSAMPAAYWRLGIEERLHGGEKHP